MTEAILESAIREQNNINENTVQRESYGPEGGMLSDQISSRIQNKRGSGSALSQNDINKYSQQFGRDMSDVRIHSDSESGKLNETLNSRAFTIGSDIFLGKGISPKDNPRDSETLAHELTHVAQNQGKAGSGRLQLGAVDTHEEAEASSLSKQVRSGTANSGTTVRREFGFHPFQGILKAIDSKEGNLYANADSHVGGALEKMSEEDKETFNTLSEELKKKKEELSECEKTRKDIPAWKEKKTTKIIGPLGVSHKKAFAEADRKQGETTQEIQNTQNRLTGGNDFNLAGDTLANFRTSTADPQFNDNTSAQKKLEYLQGLLNKKDNALLNGIGTDIISFNHKYENSKALDQQYNDKKTLRDNKQDELNTAKDNLRPTDNDAKKRFTELKSELENLEEEFKPYDEAHTFINTATNTEAYDYIQAIMAKIDKVKKNEAEDKKKLANLQRKEKLHIKNPDAYNPGNLGGLTEQDRLKDLDQLAQNYDEEIKTLNDEISEIKNKRLAIVKKYNKKATAEEVENYQDNKNGLTRFLSGFAKGIWNNIKGNFNPLAKFFGMDQEESEKEEVAKGEKKDENSSAEKADEDKEEKMVMGDSADALDKQIEELGKRMKKAKEEEEKSITVGKDSKSLADNIEALKARKQKMADAQTAEKYGIQKRPDVLPANDNDDFEGMNQTLTGMKDKVNERNKQELGKKASSQSDTVDIHSLSDDELKKATDNFEERIKNAERLQLMNLGMLDADQDKIQTKIQELESIKNETDTVHNANGDTKISRLSSQKLKEVERQINFLKAYQSKLSGSQTNIDKFSEGKTKDQIEEAIEILKKEKKRRTEKRAIEMMGTTISDQDLDKVIKQLEAKKS